MSEQEWINIFGDNLVELIAEHGYSQREFADAAGLTESAISQYINKHRMPTVKAIINMAYVLGLDLDEFIDFGDRLY